MTRAPERVRPGDLLVLAGLLAAVLAWPLVSPPVGTHGEAREGLVAQDIVRHGHWVLPVRNGALPSKPPLFHWVAALLACVFGLSDVTLRLPSALAAWVMAATTLALGVAIGGRCTGWLAVGALLGVFHFWLSASEARVDMVFAACITVSLAGFFFWYRRPAPGAGAGRGARAACYLGAAFAVLAKGPAGLVLPGLVIAAFLTWTRELALLRRLWSWPLAAAVLLLDLGWYGLAVRAGGEEFVALQLLYENVDRFLGRDSFARHAADPGFRHFPFRMPLDFARHFFPWDLVLVSAALRAASGKPEDATGRLLHVWWITILVFFTLASGQRSVYLLPAAPAIALLAGRALAAVAAGALPLHLPRAVPGAVRRHPVPGLLAAVALFDLSIAAAGQAVRQHRARRESLAEFAARTAALVPADAPLYAARDLEPSPILVLAYRLGRAIGREPAGCTPGAYVLVPEPGAGAAVPRRGGVLLSTVRAHESIALVRMDDEGACGEP